MNLPRRSPDPPSRSGFFYGLGAYGLWGILPIYFKLIPSVSAFAIVAHRVVWSVPFLALLLLVGKRLPKLRATFRDRRAISILLLSSLMIGINWMLYT